MSRCGDEGTLWDTPEGGVSLCPPSPQHRPPRGCGEQPGDWGGCRRTGETRKHFSKSGARSSTSFAGQRGRSSLAKWPYNTTAWKKLRKLKLMSSPFCEDCEDEGRYTIANVVDHCVAISQGGAPFPPLDALASLCQRHHSMKTARGPEAGAVRTSKPRRGCDASGMPLDPAHPWRKNRSELPPLYHPSSISDS